MATLVRTILRGGFRFGLRLRLSLDRRLHGLGRSFHSLGSSGAGRSCGGREPVPEEDPGSPFFVRRGRRCWRKMRGTALGWAAEPVVVGAPVVGCASFRRDSRWCSSRWCASTGRDRPRRGGSRCGAFGSIFRLGGTVGKRSAKISMALAAPFWSGSACLSSIFVTTRTSSTG